MCCSVEVKLREMGGKKDEAGLDFLLGNFSWLTLMCTLKMFDSKALEFYCVE